MLTAPRLIQAFSRMWAYVTISERDALWVWLRAFAGVNSDGSTRTPCSMYALDCHDHRSGSGEDTFFFLTAYPSSDNTLRAGPAQWVFGFLNMAVHDAQSMLQTVVSSHIGDALTLHYIRFSEEVFGPDGMPVSVRHFAVQLLVTVTVSDGTDWDEVSQLTSWLLGVLYSRLPMLPDVRLVCLTFHHDLLRRTARNFPEVMQLPTLDGRIFYQWSCTTSDLKVQTAESARLLVRFS